MVEGPVVEITEATEIKIGKGRRSGSMAQVLRALAEGLVVETRGQGFETSTTPLTVSAQKVEFRIGED